MPSSELTLWYLFIALCCSIAYQTPNMVNKKPVGVKQAFQVFFKSLLRLGALVFFGALFLGWIGGGEGLPFDTDTSSLLASMFISLTLSVIFKTKLRSGNTSAEAIIEPEGKIESIELKNTN